MLTCKTMVGGNLSDIFPPTQTYKVPIKIYSSSTHDIEIHLFNR